MDRTALKGRGRGENRQCYAALTPIPGDATMRHRLQAAIVDRDQCFAPLQRAFPARSESDVYTPCFKKKHPLILLAIS